MIAKKLRKCMITRTIKGEEGAIYYFHGWSNASGKEFHPEDPAKDVVYSYMVGVVENVETGVVSTEEPSYIIFITD